jgi:group II intron reverse transcriptase/maturase
MRNKSMLKEIASMETLRQAWQRVKENQGCRGSDGVTIEEFDWQAESHLAELAQDLLNQTYAPFPLMRFQVPKRNKQGLRYLSVPTIRDRVAQTSVYMVTREIFEKEFESFSHAYRLGRGVRTAIKEIEFWRDNGYRHAVDADIASYFDTVSHDRLIQKLMVLFKNDEICRLFEKWIRVQVYDGRQIWKLEKGIPQGSVVSPMLANLFLDELDEMLMEFDRKLVRYSDDFIILCKSEQEFEETIELTDMILEDMDLDLNLKKTQRVSFDRGFKFLGALFLYDNVYIPFPKKREKDFIPQLPPPLTLKRYIELTLLK